jgi:hypothetical protein
MFKLKITLWLAVLLCLPTLSFAQTDGMAQLEMSIPQGGLTLQQAQQMALAGLAKR